MSFTNLRMGYITPAGEVAFVLDWLLFAIAPAKADERDAFGWADSSHRPKNPCASPTMTTKNKKVPNRWPTFAR